MTISLIHIISLGCVAALSCLIFTPLSKKLAFRLDAIDYPSARRLNTTPTPRLGGLALFAAFFVTIIVEFAGEMLFGWTGFFQSANQLGINYVAVMLGIAVTVFVGTIDDIYQISPGFKLAGQIVAATIIAISGILITEIRNPFSLDSIHFGWFAYPLTVIYLVFFANIINLVDGLDGLAAGVVGIAALALLIIAFNKERAEAAIFAVITAGICLGFLRYNLPPASVFMGDSGALMLGMMLGVISLAGVIRSSSAIVLAVPIVIAGLPAIDTTLAIIRRLRWHQPVHAADMEHLHHKLLRKGVGPKRALVAAYLWTAILAVGGILISNTSGFPVLGLFAALALASVFALWRFGLFDTVLRHFYSPRKKQSHHDQDQ
jgi:UDP-GlcNAc:undecaprenyl-phosphate GlcNAc-1-phosphate transferase